ncbi:MGT family glycosyltransferase [Dolichospermum sp. UHCC 0352]|jgi:MGT family glycosyltransferase|uniref:macrolide family glycosyltransferase n=1 Tax=Dolichospermum sp. UHCC 0352 TaxID=2590011 RepID=UPI0014486A21|nr:macrolide family glycosyltransferase [Dolichospermum sp. UHCC 0352]MTJ23216.1 MGT family glycosyltransferase [Dolichospermum sp. UHCC 0352]
MGRVVFFNVSAAGHVIPTLGLVKELIHRGEEVIYYEAPNFQAEIESFGAKFRSYPPLNPETAPPAENEMSLVPSLTWCAHQILPELLESVRAEKPDYIIHDSLCLWGRLVAQILNIPAVNSIATAAFTPQTFYECPWLRKKLPGFLKQAAAGMKHYRQYQRELRGIYGIPPIKFVDTFTNIEPLNLCYLPPELQPYSDKFDERFHFVGPCNPVRGMEYDFPMEQLQKDKLILISFGNIHDPGVEFYRSCLQAFGNTDAQVVMILSPAMDVTLLGDIPDNFIIRPTGTVPQLKILERASLFIMHGAGGGAREAVWYAVPMIAVPQTYEQEIISRRIQEQGAGIMMMLEDVTVENLQQTAQQIFDDSSFGVNSGLLGDACRAAGGVERAVNEIWRYVYEKNSN